METDRVTPEDAARALSALDQDRLRLASAVEPPRSLMAGYGAIAAWWVAQAATASPGAGYRPSSTWWLPLVAALVVATLVRRRLGLRFRRSGARATVAVVAILLLCLALFSVSLALVSLDLRWAVALPAAVAFGAVWWLATVAHRAALDRVARG